MSYEIIRSFTIRDNNVYVTAAASNVYPRTFNTWSPEALTKIYQEEGMKPLLKSIAESVWTGEFKLQSGSRINQYMSAVFDCMPRELRAFLDTERGAEFLADNTLKCLDKKTPPMELLDDITRDIESLDQLRFNKESVLDVSKKNAEAFSYADPLIQQDRAAAKEYIALCASMTLFAFPRYFKEDKELAMLALPKNGCIFRQLGDTLCCDKDVIRLAFDANLESRRFFEHLPDLIPSPLRKDTAFMRELIALCPSLHIHRATELLEDRETAKAWVTHGRWIPTDLGCVPKEYLQDPEFQQILLARSTEEPYQTNLRNKYLELGLMPPAIQKASLNHVIQTAEQKSSQQRPMEKEPTQPER